MFMRYYLLFITGKNFLKKVIFNVFNPSEIQPSFEMYNLVVEEGGD